MTLNARALKTLALPMVLIVAGVGFFWRDDEPRRARGKPIEAAIGASQIPILSSRVMVVEDLERARPKPAGAAALRPTSGIQIVSLRSRTGIPAGSEARAILESGATNGIIKAKLLAPIIIDGEPILPERTVLVGKGTSTEERLFVEFTTAVLQGGETLRLRAQAFDGKDKILGLKGSMVGGKTGKMLWGAGLGFVGGMAAGLQQPTSGSYFMPERQPSVRDAALAGASKAALDQSQLALEDVRSAPVIIEVKRGTEFFIITDDADGGREKP